jgi:hypothetical protein
MKMATIEERKSKFIEKAKVVHAGENLDYSQVEYKDNRTPVKIIDHDLRPDGTEYGEFWQTPWNHLKGQMHPDKRGMRISATKQSKQEEIIERFKKVHAGENLDYSQVEYKGMHVKVKIISHDLKPDGTEYGEFWQEPVVHLKGCTHPEIGRRKQILKQSSTTEEFINKGKIVHADDDYSYEYVDYINTHTKVDIFCNKTDSKGKVHGLFSIMPDNFLAGKGCPKCGNHLSNGEDEIIDMIKKLKPNTKIEKCNHSILNGKELDIYLPDEKIAFEFDGLRWHCELFNKDKLYHLHKKQMCETKGIILFHIFEDEYLYHKEALFAKIKHILNSNEYLPKIGARKCIIKEIDKETAKEFLNKNHIQGYSKATLHLGGFYKNKLISVMSFMKERTKDDWILIRSCNDYDYIVQGMTSKMFKYFLKHYKCKEVKTFLDRRWEYNPENNVYIKCGFEIDSYLDPDYRYTNGHGERHHKFGFRKKILHNKYGFPLTMTEREMTEKLGYYKIWDCGLIKYIYKNPNYL